MAVKLTTLVLRIVVSRATIVAMEHSTLLRFPGASLRRALHVSAQSDSVFLMANIMGTKNLVKNVHSMYALMLCAGLRAGCGTT